MTAENVQQLFQQLTQRLNTLDEQNQFYQTQLSLGQQFKSDKPKLHLPERFDGDKKKLRGFLNQIELAFTLTPTKYPTNSIKVAFVGSLLTGRALSWFNPMFEKKQNFGHLLDDWEAFKTALMDTFGDPDRVRAAKHKL